MPQNSFTGWSFRTADDTETVAGEMFAAIEEYGLPYMERMLDLSAFVEEYWMDGWSQRYFIIPSIYDMQGRYAECREFLSMSLKSVSDDVLQDINRIYDYADFCRRFNAYLDAKGV